MKILVVNQYFPPDTSATAAVLEDYVQHFLAAGHDVRVIAGRPSYNADSAPIDDQASLTSHPAVVVRVASTSFSRHRRLARVANYLSFVLLAFLRIRFGKRPDVVVVGTDPPIAILAAVFGVPRGVPLLYNIQDLHPDAAVAAGWLRAGLIARMWDKVHSKVMKRADKVVVLSRSMERAVLRKGVKETAIEIIANGARPVQDRPDPSVVEEIRAGDDFVALHAGNLGAAGEWTTIVTAASLLPDGCAIAFVGGGASADLVEAHGARVLPFFPPDKVASVMAAGDLQIVSIKPGLDSFMFPSKLHTILMYGRPVLVVGSPSGELAVLIESLGCGLVADGRDPKDVADKIVWAATNPSALASMAGAARRAAPRFDRAKSAERWLSLVETAVDARRNRTQLR